MFKMYVRCIGCIHVHAYTLCAEQVPNFTEVWPDEGDINMPMLAKTLFDAGYPCVSSYGCIQ